MSAQLAMVLPMPAARRDGMDAAADNAGPEWRARAFTFLCGYARAHQIIGPEEVSDAFEAAGGAVPPSRRAWASLYRQAVRDRVLSFLDNDGWSKRRHSPARRYLSQVFA